MTRTRGGGRCAFDKPGVDFAPIDKDLVDPAEVDAALVDRDGTPSPDDQANTARRRDANVRLVAGEGGEQGREVERCVGRDGHRDGSLIGVEGVEGR